MYIDKFNMIVLIYARLGSVNGISFILLGNQLQMFWMQLAAKLEALRHEYMRFAVEKCSSVLREYRSAVETITGILIYYLFFLQIPQSICLKGWSYKQGNKKIGLVYWTVISCHLCCVRCFGRERRDQGEWDMGHLSKSTTDSSGMYIICVHYFLCCLILGFDIQIIAT